MNETFTSQRLVSEESLDDYMTVRHGTSYRRDAHRDGFTVSMLLQGLHRIDSVVGWPHRAYLKGLLKLHFRGLSKRGIHQASVAELSLVDRYAIDLWTVVWPLAHLLLLYPGIYLMSISLVSGTGPSLLLGAPYLILYALSLYRCVDVLVTLGRLHLAPAYTPHTSPRAVVGTLAQLVDITMAYASTYMLLRVVLGHAAFSGSKDVLSTVLAPLYYSLVTMTLNLSYAEFATSARIVQLVNIAEFLTGIALLIVVLQKVISPRRTRFEEGLTQRQKQDPIAGRVEERENPSWQDQFYAGFLDEFRHSEDFVRGLFERFVQVFEEKEPVLDIGCGRGEFLEVMRDAGIDSYGIDTNWQLILRCRRKNLNVVQDDWRQHLARVADGRLGGVFAAQLAEHLRPDELMEFFRLAHTKLRDDGRLVVETLTPCLYTMVAKFYVDFSHRAPLNPNALRFLASYVGFQSVEVDYYNQPSEDERLREIHGEDALGDLVVVMNRNTRILNNLVFLPHYFCLIATKGAHGAHDRGAGG